MRPPTSDAASAPRPARFGLVSGVIACALLGLFAWSLVSDREQPSTTTRVAPQPAAPRRPVAVETVHEPEAPIIRPRPPAIARSVEITPPRRLPALPRLGGLQADGRLSPTSLAAALGGVTVINVWATYCAPCMRELPRLIDLFATRGWGTDVRLLPVLLEAPDAHNQQQAAALAALSGIPGARQVLVDLTPAGAMQTILHDMGLLPDRATLPLTLVLDCEQKARWLHLGELDDTVALAEMIERLRRELPRCAAAAALAEGCGDRRCEDARGETCATCPIDCACGPGRECVVLPDRPARCNFSVQGLKD